MKSNIKSERTMTQFQTIEFAHLGLKQDLPEDFIRLHSRNSGLTIKVVKLENALFWTCMVAGALIILMAYRLNQNQNEESKN